MINNYFTLKALIEEIRDEVVSSEIEACYTRVERTLEIIITKSGGPPNVIIVSCRPRSNYIFMRSAPRRHTGAGVMHGAVGLSILTADLIENERSVVMGLSGDKFLVINLFGPHANVYITDRAGEVEDAFLRKRRTEAMPIPAGRHSWEGNTRNFCNAFSSSEGNPLHRLVALLPPFGGELGREAFFRTGGDDMVRASRTDDAVLDEEKIASLYNEVSKMLHDLSQPKPRIYYEGDNPVMMSLIDMRHLGGLRKDEYDSVNVCVGAYSVNAEKHKGDADLRMSVVERLAKRKDELAKTIGKIEADISGNREARYRKYGDMIMAHLDAIEEGAEVFSDEASGENVRLEPRLTAVQNAQAYYERAKKARASYHQAVARKEELKKSLANVEAELKNVESNTDMGRIISMVKKEKARERTQTPFREFETNGYRIYVGKDAKNNDELTFGFAKPNDVFLHARGVSGSHVIIRNGSREYPQKAVLEYAARIAAHYSKARSSGIVPVAFTMRKFVKKAKGQPGAVLMDREEVIFVKPGIPQ